MNIKHNVPEYTLQRSARRRTIEIQVRPDSIKVLAPKRVSQARIDCFVVEKTDWIRTRQQELLLRRSAQLTPVLLEQGSQLLWLGERFKLCISNRASQTRVQLLPDEIKLELSRRIRKPQSEAVVEQLEYWYREQALQLFQQRVNDWSGLMGVVPSTVVVRSYRRKWGCCNSRGVVSFNWLLIMAPLNIIDYVIVHELSHLREMNHSSRFWLEVEKFYPDYPKAKTWLNDQGRGLQWPPVQSDGDNRVNFQGAS